MLKKLLWWNKTRRPAKRRTTVTKHYQDHKEYARAFVHARVEYWNQYYNFDYGRIAIRNQKTCWGSCSEYGNLNFNYKLVFIPQHLADYIVVHELCHLQEFNHSKAFWDLVGETLPEYKQLRDELRDVKIDTRRRLSVPIDLQ